MSPQKRVVLRLFDEVVNEGRLDRVGELYAPGFVDHAPGPGQAPGPEGIAQMLAQFRDAVPDIRCRVEHVVEEGDLVATRETWEGTVRKAYRGVAPDGARRRGTRMHVFRLREGRIVEEWSEGAGIFGFAPPTRD